MNLKDLKSVKNKALKENNFSQIENFIDYESFVSSSYLTELLRFLLYLSDILKAQASSSTLSDQASEFFSNMSLALVQRDKELSQGLSFGVSEKKGN